MDYLECPGSRPPESRGLTLDALSAKCGIAKPNLSRLENDKVTPKFETLRTVAAGLGVHPALLVEKHAWSQTQYAFDQWNLGLLRDESVRGSRLVLVHAVDMVNVFLATRPEHRYARMKLLNHANRAPHDSGFDSPAVDAQKWAREVAAADAATHRQAKQKVKSLR